MWPFRRKREDRDLWNVGGYPFGAGTASGVNVGTDSALQLSAVWSCVRLVSDVVSTMPLHAYRGEEQLSRAPALLANPAAHTDLPTWLQQLVISALLNGNSYGLVTARAGAALRPIQVEWVDTKRVGCVTAYDGTVEYRVDGREIDRDDLVHFKAYSTPGNPVGLSPISYARETIGLGIAAERYGGQFFGQANHPSGVFTFPQGTKAHQVTEFKKLWDAGSSNSRRLIYMGGGAKFEPILVPDDQAQFLASQKFTVQQIARVFGIPPECIGAESGNEMTYANIESRDLALLKYGVAPWLVRIEAMLDQLMPIGVHTKFNTGGLLRTDLKTRYESYKLGLEGGWLTLDEVRELEDRAPLEQPAPPPQIGVAA